MNKELTQIPTAPKTVMEVSYRIVHLWSGELFVFNVLPWLPLTGGLAFSLEYEFHSQDCGKLRRLWGWSPSRFQSLESHMFSFQMEKWMNIHHSAIRNANFPSLPGTGQGT